MLFPNHKRFAFTILDDTDDATLVNVEPVYRALRTYGLRTTKTVWPLDCPEGSRLFFAGETLQNKDYCRFVHGLVQDGFELALHGATMESSLRERTVRGLEFLKKEFGAYPKLFCNHGFNRENVYWGSERFQSGLFRQLARFISRDRSEKYEGHERESPYFWGDLCQERVKYVRNFTFRRLDMLEVNPDMPYRLRQTRYVNYWFSTSDAPDVGAFNRLLTRRSIDQLEDDGGLCIISTHLGKGFAKDGKLNPETDEILKYISMKDGWFVPVSEILDHLLNKEGRGAVLRYAARTRLELRFILDKLFPQA